MADNSLYNLYSLDTSHIHEHQPLDFDGSGQEIAPTYKLWEIVIHLRKKKCGNDNQIFYNYLHDEIGIIPALGMEQKKFQSLIDTQDEAYRTTLKGELIGNAISELKIGRNKTYLPYLLAWLWHDHPDVIKNFYTKIDLKHREFPSHNDLEQTVKTENTHKSKNNYIDPFQTRIESLSKDFFERKYVFDQINKFLHENNSGYITVRGEGGAGKSAILANAVQKYRNSEEFNCVWYFIRYGTGYDRLINFIDHLYRRLGAIYNLQSLEKDHEKITSSKGYDIAGVFLDRLVATVAQQTDQKLFIIVDALDEIANDDPTKVNSATNLFYIPKQLPKNIFFLISSRNENQQNYKGKELALVLGKDEPHQKQDIRGYIKKKTALDEVKKWIAKNKLSQENFVELLCKKSEYLFIYLFHVFQDISEYNKDSLPQGITDYYHDQYNRLLVDEDGKEKRQIILAGISNFKPDISLGRLSIFCNLEPFELNRLIKHWFDIRLIEKVKQDKAVYLKFWHHSFYEFINKHVQDIEEIYQDEKLHKKLAKNIVQDIHINDELEDVSYRESVFSDKMQIETIKLIPESLLWAQNAESLSEYLTNRAFCKEYIKQIGDRELVSFFEKMCAVGRYSEGFKADIVMKFYEKIISKNNKQVPVLDNKRIDDITVHDPHTEFMTHYTSSVSKSLKEKVNRE